MQGRLRRGGVLAQLVCALCAGWAASASAQPATGPRETVDQSFTSTQPGSPTGVSYSGVYHAAGDPQGNPPFLRRMVFYAPPGMRYDTSVPDRCTATDVELEARGPDACPPGSRLGTGTAEGLFFVPFAHDVVFDHYKHTLHVLNNANEQILLVESEGFTVVRGKVRPDGSIEFNPTTCFPAPPTGQCADDYILQLKSSTVIPAYTRTSRGRVRSYVTTPPTCPAAGAWQSVLRFWWSDGSTDSVTSEQPCQRAARVRHHAHRHRHRRTARPHS